MAAQFDLKVGETLLIGNVAALTLIKKSGQLAHLVVDAPANIKVEVKSNSAASQAAKGIGVVA